MKKSLALILLLSACNLSPEYERPVVETPAWRGAQAAEVNEVPKEWWRKFGSEELNNVVAASLDNNTDIAASVQRIEQARSAAKGVDSALYPQVNASADAGRTQISRTSNNGTSTSYRAGLSVAYEVDLFGRNRANSSAAAERIKTSEFDHEALALIISSDTANVYAQIISLEDRLAIARKNLSNASRVLDIVQARFEEGRTSGLELAQQKASLANTQTNISNLEQQKDILRDQLAVLNGKAPQNFYITAKTMANLTIPQIAPGQPSALLERRPDISAAESALKAANIDIGAARAAYFPSLDIGLNSALTANPVSSVTTGLAASLLAPIFSGGAIEAGVEQSKARKEELAVNYRGTVLIAFKEVEDALAAVKGAEMRVQSLKQAAAQSQKAYDIARYSYEEGSTDYQTLLDTERTLFQAEDSLAGAKYEQLAAAIDLYKALGGGWKENS